MSLTPRWTRLDPLAEQLRYRASPHRFNVVPAGRRSGKTERLKRKVVGGALRGTDFFPARFFLAAPTRDQAKRIFWDDIKALVPHEFIRKVSETDLMVQLPLSEIWVVGMDKPQRIEGTPWDGGGLDEYGNMKPKVWGENVRPMLSDRLGWCDFIGVPEGRNHYYELYQRARAEMVEKGEDSEWGAFHWVSADILPPEEIEAARRDLDELTFQQEYEASFINFVGRAYYPFNEGDHCPGPLDYNPKAPLMFCFDFNVAPGVAAVCQEMRSDLEDGFTGTGVIGEVWIPQNSNTRAVCRRLIQDWGEHKGRVFCYGDATGGARGSAKTEGSDWDLVKEELRPAFDERLFFRVPKANPAERARINALNTRLKNGAGDVHLLVDPSRAPHVVRDLEGVRLLEGGSGELDKKNDPQLTHISDALGYYVVGAFPTTRTTASSFQFKIG